MTTYEQNKMARQIANEILLKMKPMVKEIVQEIMNSTKEEIEEPVSITKAADILGMSVGWMYQNYKENIPYYKEGGKIKFLPSQLQHYMKHHLS